MRYALFAFTLGSLLAYLWVALTGHHKDNLAGPFLGVLLSLVLVLGVGVAGDLMGPERQRSEL